MRDVVELALVERVKRERKSQGLTQEHVAKALGCSRPSYANIESGRQGISLSQAALMAQRVGLIELSDILTLLGVEELLDDCPVCLGDGTLIVRKTSHEVCCTACSGIGSVPKSKAPTP